MHHGIINAYNEMLTVIQIVRFHRSVCLGTFAG